MFFYSRNFERGVDVTKNKNVKNFLSTFSPIGQDTFNNNSTYK